MENILVSACLLGVRCRYDGNCQNIAGFNDILPRLMEKYNLIPVCPEVFGGMSTPRKPSEIKTVGEGFEVVNNEGENVTEHFERGACEALKLAHLYNCRKAILKMRSPSCGSGEVYDGTFTKKIIQGNGITARELLQAGLTIYNEVTCIELL